MQLKEIAK